MGDIPNYFDIILFGMVAAFLVLRLRSVLGRRTGNERRRDAFPQRPAPVADTVVSLGARPGQLSPTSAAHSVADGLATITAVEPSFNVNEFLDGARGAFELIVSGFARGDKPALRSLLSDEVFIPFSAAIDERVAAGETLETRIEKLKDVDIVAAEMQGHEARLTVKLVSDQIHVLRAHDGSVVDGDPQKPIEKTDFWTFARETRSNDPNWLLVATGSA